MKTLFKSRLAAHFDSFLTMKLSCGYRYVAEQGELHRLDGFLHLHDCPADCIGRELTSQWIAKRDHERPRNHESRLRMYIQFAKYVQQRHVEAHIPDSRLTQVNRVDFVPFIFSRQQIKCLLDAVDRMGIDARSPERHIIMPELFRLLCYCGLRVTEVCKLKVGDVDTHQGVLQILDTKFRKNRLVPVAKSLNERLRDYSERMSFRSVSDPFFPTARGTSYAKGSIYALFRRFLNECNIPHGGRGKGPRLHDLRHTFAVHCLERWYKDGEDINARLPLLVTYLGHRKLSGTQRYLQLTPAIYPDINNRLERLFQDCTSQETPQ